MKIEDLAVYKISHISVYTIVYIVYIVLYPTFGETQSQILQLGG
jgi:hypothetical protein